jgi:UDPglucose--hexose-1-phosphate uridylyltransferase
MYTLEMRKQDGRLLTLYGNLPLQCSGVAPSPSVHPPAVGSHMRWQPLRGEWVAYAPLRQDRTFLPPANFHPLRPTVDLAFPTELPEGNYDVAVFDNLFPTLSLDAANVPDLIVPTRDAHGHCEVIVYSQDPQTSLGTLELEHIELLLEVWGRHTELNRQRGFSYVLPFENRGVEVGVTLGHPHGQIYSYPFVPPVPERMWQNEVAHYERTGVPLLQQLLEHEATSGERLIYLGPHAIAVVPACARYSYEVWVAPRRAIPYLYELSLDVRKDLARALKTALLKLDGLWGRPMPYVSAWFQAPTDGRAHPESHLHAEIYPAYRTRNKLKYLAGTELAAGTFASDTLPETTARELRAVPVEVGR